MQTKLQPGDALLIVDPQIDFFPGGALAVPQGDEIIPILNEWISAARAANIPIIVSRDWHPPNHISFKPQGGPWPIHCVQNTEGAKFHPQLQLPKDIIISSKASQRDQEAYSAFEGMTEDQKSLPEKLHELHIHRIWIAGLALDYCVRYTALSAHQAGLEYHVILPATRAIAKDTERQTLTELKEQNAILETNPSPHR